MAQDATQIIATRNFIVYEKDYDSSNDLPADTVAYGTAWSGYTNLGYTQGGITFAANLDRNTINVDQVLDPVLQPISARNVTMSGNLAQWTPQIMRSATGMGSIVQVTPSSGVRGHDDLYITGSQSDIFKTIGFDAEQQNGEAFRGILYRSLASGNPSPVISPDDAAAVAFEFSAQIDDSTSPARVARIRRVLAAL